MSHVPRAIAWRFLSGLIKTKPEPDTDLRSDPEADRLEAARRVDERLLTMLQMVNEWLHFAEAKNTGIVALDSLVITAILAYVADSEVRSPLLLTGMLVTSLLLLFSLGASLLSFLPQDNLRRMVTKTTHRGGQSRNLYFFRDLAAFEPEQLATAVAQEYEKIPDYDPAEYRGHIDLAAQIIANSQITVDKNAYFRLAATFFLAGVGASGVFTIFSVIASIFGS